MKAQWPGRNKLIFCHHRASASIEYVLVLFSMVILGGALLSTLGLNTRSKYERIIYNLEQALISSATAGDGAM